jgi:phospholipid/cholesterol/gamma-HCH transport system substrate-binding protein
MVRAQLVVPEPGAPIALDTQKIVPRTTGPEAATFGSAQWSDTVPKLIQAKVIEALDNSRYLSAVSRPMEGLAADYQLLIDIRSFQVAAAPGEAAEAELAAKVLGNSGRIVAGKVFTAKAFPVSAEAPAAIAALDEAFGRATVELSVWVANVLQGQPPQKRS